MSELTFRESGELEPAATVKKFTTVRQKGSQ